MEPRVLHRSFVQVERSAMEVKGDLTICTLSSPPKLCEGGAKGGGLGRSPNEMDSNRP